MVGFGLTDLGTSGLTVDGDCYKFRIGTAADAAAGLQFLVTIEVDSGLPQVAQVLEDRCGPTVLDQILYMTAATLGDCGTRRAKANASSILTAGVYQAAVFPADAFGPGNGIIASPIPCSFTGDPAGNPNAGKYVLRVNATPLPSATLAPPIGAAPKTGEAFEGCPLGLNPLPSDLNSHCPGQSNDGCAVGTFQSDSIANGDVVTGQLFSQLDATNNNPTWLGDQDYYSFTVAPNTLRRVTVSGRADGPVVVAIANVGPNGSLCIADRPGSEGSQPAPRGGVRIVDSFDLSSSDTVLVPTAAVREVFLTPGTYALAVSPGTVADGLATQDLNCSTNSQISYFVSLNMQAIGSCCNGSSCSQTTAANCPVGLTFTDGAVCDAGFSAGVAGSGGTFASISGTGTAVPFDQDNGNLVVPTLPAGWTFNYFGSAVT